MTQVRSLRLLALSSTSLAALIVLGATDARAQTPPVYSWSGFYIGANAGYGIGSSRWTDGGTPPGPCCSWASDFTAHYTTSINADGFAYGFHAGYNFQTGRVVVGVETDINWLNDATGRFAWNIPNSQTGTSPGIIDTKMDWVGSTRLRAGVTFDRLLVFVTGGIAYGNGSEHWTQSISGAQWNVSKQKIGTALGGGFEWMLTQNWSVRAEALYMDFNTIRANDVTPAGVADFGLTSGYVMTSKVTETIARIGATYRF